MDCQQAAHRRASPSALLVEQAKRNHVLTCPTVVFGHNDSEVSLLGHSSDRAERHPLLLIPGVSKRRDFSIHEFPETIPICPLLGSQHYVHLRRSFGPLAKNDQTATAGDTLRFMRLLI